MPTNKTASNAVTGVGSAAHQRVGGDTDEALAVFGVTSTASEPIATMRGPARGFRNGADASNDYPHSGQDNCRE